MHAKCSSAICTSTNTGKGNWRKKLHFLQFQAEKIEFQSAHNKPLVSLYTPGFPMFSMSVERDQWHEIV